MSNMPHENRTTAEPYQVNEYCGIKCPGVARRDKMPRLTDDLDTQAPERTPERLKRLIKYLLLSAREHVDQKSLIVSGAGSAVANPFPKQDVGQQAY